MSTHVAEVVRANEDTAWLRSGRSSNCGGCQSENSCGISSLGKVFNKNKILFKVENTLGVKKNDKVLVHYDDAALLKASFLGYVWPILFFFLFAMGGTYLKNWLSVSSEWPVILAAFCGMLIAGLFLKRIGFSMQSVTLESRLTPL